MVGLEVETVACSHESHGRHNPFHRCMSHTPTPDRRHRTWNRLRMYRCSGTNLEAVLEVKEERLAKVVGGSAAPGAAVAVAEARLEAQKGWR